MYNFHKLREANFESHFHHDHFRKDDRSAMSEIKRKPEKKKHRDDDYDDEGTSNISFKKHIRSQKTAAKELAP